MKSVTGTRRPLCRRVPVTYSAQSQRGCPEPAEPIHQYRWLGVQVGQPVDLFRRSQYQPSTCFGDDRRDVGRGQSRIHWQWYCISLHHAEKGFEEAGTIGKHDQHPIVRAHAELSQRGGYCGRPIGRLGMAHRVTVAMKGFPFTGSNPYGQ